MTVTKTDHRSIVVLELATRIQALITYGQGIVKAMTGNPPFPTIVPLLAARGFRKRAKRRRPGAIEGSHAARIVCPCR